jgi:aminopeptidase N
VEAFGPIGPPIPRRFGISEGVLFAPTFYPLVARLVDGDWEVQPAPPGGDTTNSEIAFYEVRFDAPAELALAATGVELERTEQGGRQQVSFVSGPTRDFAFALGPLLEVSRQVGEVTVRAWALAEHAEDRQTMLEAAARQVQILSRLVGPYPYPELDLVDVPGAYGGIEYPGLVSIGTLGTHQVIEPTVHEVAHQWFYGLVGDDQLEEPWLDEAFATYSEVLYYEQTAGSGRATGTLSAFRDLLRSSPNPNKPIGLPVDSYDGIEEYGLFVYLKGALFFDALRAEVGDELFFAFLRSYFEAYRYRIASGREFQATAEQTCACDLGPLFDLWVWQGGELPGL